MEIVRQLSPAIFYAFWKSECHVNPMTSKRTLRLFKQVCSIEIAERLMQFNRPPNHQQIRSIQ